MSPEVARSAREHFQPRYPQPLTDEDGREIATNLLGAFAILKEWRDKQAASAGTPTTTAPVPRFKPKRRRSSPPAQE